MKPIVIKAGNIQVKIYRTQTRGYPGFQVADYTGGQRKLISFANEADARAKAGEIAVALTKGDVGALTLRQEEKASYLRALELLRPCGVSLELAAATIADAHKRLGGRTISEAIGFFLKRNPTALPEKRVEIVVQELVEAKKQDGCSAVYLKDLTLRLGKFAEAFQCSISTISQAELNAWLRALKCGPRSRNNYRGAVRALFAFAGSSGYVPKDGIDFEEVAEAKEGANVIEIFTPEEMMKLLEAAQINPDDVPVGFNKRYSNSPLLPLLILGGFAGLRTGEIKRQKWEDVMLDRGFIRVTAGKGGTAQKRLVPITDNCRAWLLTCWRKSGTCCEIARVPDAIIRLAKRAGVEWKHNALRHSFISYRVAGVQDVAKVSLEAGNSPRMIHRHYREVVTADEAKTWFAIMPILPGKVEPMPTAAPVASKSQSDTCFAPAQSV